MKQVPLSMGYIAFVDDEDFERVSRYKWHAHKTRNSIHAKRDTKRPNRKTIFLHNFILGNPAPGMEIDHRDGNGLNCQKDNMRYCTHADNSKNQSKRKNNTSGYKGVFWSRGRKKWCAHITVNYKRIFIGYFDSIEDAANAYGNAALKYFGDFARKDKEDMPEESVSSSEKSTLHLSMDVIARGPIRDLALSDFYIRIVELAEEMGLEIGGGGYEQKDA
jgi:hypothetical protein